MNTIHGFYKNEIIYFVNKSLENNEFIYAQVKDIDNAVDNLNLMDCVWIPEILGYIGRTSDGSIVVVAEMDNIIVVCLNTKIINASDYYSIEQIIEQANKTKTVVRVKSEQESQYIIERIARETRNTTHDISVIVDESVYYSIPLDMINIGDARYSYFMVDGFQCRSAQTDVSGIYLIEVYDLNELVNQLLGYALVNYCPTHRFNENFVRELINEFMVVE